MADQPSRAERIKAIVDAAEEAAAGIIEGAEIEAAAEVERSRKRAEQEAADRTRAEIAGTDEVVSRAEEVVRRSDEMIATLQGMPPAKARPARHTSFDAARLLATQLAVTGASREDVERRLRDEFGIENAGSILDSIY